MVVVLVVNVLACKEENGRCVKHPPGQVKTNVVGSRIEEGHIEFGPLLYQFLNKWQAKGLPLCLGERQEILSLL